jgi:hypothetical protein
MAVQTTKEVTAANHTIDISDLAGWASSAHLHENRSDVSCVIFGYKKEARH